MRAIIIEDKDCKALLDQLQLDRLEVSDGGQLQRFDGTKGERQLVHDIHRRFHFVVTRWLQAQGWNS